MARVVARLKQKYVNEIVPELREQFNLKNVMQVPKVEKVVVNMGVGIATQDSKAMEGALADMAIISGQKPRLNRARKSVAGFKLREGVPIGCKVTLRGDRMYEFLDRLFSLTLPRIRDFRGLSLKSFDGRGGYSFGITEQLVFPEIDYDKIDRVRGMDICIATTAPTDDLAKALLERMGMPFKRSKS